MSRFIHNPKIPPKLLAAVAFIFIAIVCIAGLLLFHYRASMLEERQNKVRHMVERVFTLVEYYHAKVALEGLSEDDARHYALQTIRELPRNKNDYFWINDMHPTMILHPFLPEMEGKDCTDWADMDGKLFFYDMLDTVRKNGAGFITYSWPKPDRPKDKGFQKLSYVKGFSPWGWVVGSGIYIDDVNDAFRRAVYVTGSLLLLVCVFAFVFVLTVTEGFKKP